jgi:hypothetical protein
VNNKIRQFLNKGKEKLSRRLRRKYYSDQKHPQFRGGNIRYTVTEKESAIGYGGIGAIHTLVRRLKFDRLINQGVRLLQRHVPYHESDHVLSMAYNILTGGFYVEDIKLPASKKRSGLIVKSFTPGAGRVLPPDRWITTWLH